MKKIFLYAAALATVLVSCSKTEDDLIQNEQERTPVVKMITETVSGSRGTSTKATIANSNGNFAWTVGDNIAVHVSNGTYVYTSDDGASGASTAAATASFTVVYPEGNSRDAFAVFPSTIVDKDAANYGQEGQPLDVTLPATYTLAQVTGETSPCPMIATNAAGSGWSFYQLCGLLRLTVNCIPASTKRLEIDFDGKKVCGSFAIASPVTPQSSSIATVADDANDIITIIKDGTDVTLNDGNWLDGLVLNIPLPTGTYTKITVTAYDALTGGTAIYTLARTFSYTATNKNATKRNIPAVFTVDNSKLVVFAPGNLRATTTDLGANWTWSFADNQYDYVGKTVANTTINGNGTVSSNGSVDLFGYSTAANYYGISNSTDAADYAGDFKDWGTIGTFSYRGMSTEYPSDYWRSLTANSDFDKNCDWRLLYNTRATRATVNGTANARFTFATINTNGTPVNGLILFPDDFDGITPAGVEWGTINGTSAWGTKCTTAGWTALDLAGCVFLPVTNGRRNGNTFWSESEGWYRPHMFGSSNFCINFGSNSFYRNLNLGRQYGMAVRLVHQIN